MATTLDAEDNNFLSRLNSENIISDRGRLIRSVKLLLYRLRDRRNRSRPRTFVKNSSGCDWNCQPELMTKTGLSGRKSEKPKQQHSHEDLGISTPLKVTIVIAVRTSAARWRFLSRRAGSCLQRQVSQVASLLGTEALVNYDDTGINSIQGAVNYILGRSENSTYAHTFSGPLTVCYPYGRWQCVNYGATELIIARMDSRYLFC